MTEKMLDLSKNLTEKRMGLSGIEFVRFVVKEQREEDGYWYVHDIIEGNRKVMIRYFNRKRIIWSTLGGGGVVWLEEVKVSSH